MNRRQLLVRCALALGTLSLAPQGVRAADSVAKIQWQKDLKTAHRLAAEHNKPILIVFGASWCGYCHKLEKETLGDKQLAGMIQREFIPLHLDYDRDEKVAKVLEVESLPCTVILTPGADLLTHAVGYSDVKDYTQILQSALAKQAKLQQAKVQQVKHVAAKPERAATAGAAARR